MRVLKFVGIESVEKVHHIHYESMSRCQRMNFGSLEECKALGAEYVQKVVDSLNDRFPDLFVFNAARLISPKHYPADDIERS